MPRRNLFSMHRLAKSLDLRNRVIAPETSESAKPGPQYPFSHCLTCGAQLTLRDAGGTLLDTGVICWRCVSTDRTSNR